MDPNASLSTCRDIVSTITRKAAWTENDVDRLIEHFDALDNWLKGGGFLPTAWADAPVNADADDKPSHDDVWLGIDANKAMHTDRTFTEYAQIDSTYDDSKISIYRKFVEDDFVLILTRDDTTPSYWQCMRSNYTDALNTAIRKIDSLKPKEKMYLVCRDCGEAFDEVGPAHQHEDTDHDGGTMTYIMLPESEAM